MEVDSGRRPSPGFVLLDCPQAMKIESKNASLVSSISDYFLSLSNGWDLTSYLKSLSKALRGLKLGHCLSTNAKEGSSGPSTVSKVGLKLLLYLDLFFFFPDYRNLVVFLYLDNFFIILSCKAFLTSFIWDSVEYAGKSILPYFDSYLKNVFSANCLR